ncbi:hypothetical protein B0H14DRAFT_2645828 [Mycena olivaceomarginata]|nr:hypothetical protein B0H14DRAFT_2645828 [Mycena olivaceomarginata]
MNEFERRIAGNVIPGAELAAATLASPVLVTALEACGSGQGHGVCRNCNPCADPGHWGWGTAASDERRQINVYCGDIGRQGASVPPAPRSTAPLTTVAPPRSITPPTVASSAGIGVVVDIHGGSGGGSGCCSLSSFQLLLHPAGRDAGDASRACGGRSGDPSSSTGWGAKLGVLDAFADGDDGIRASCGRDFNVSSVHKRMEGTEPPTTTPTKTNMTAAEMVPDMNTAGHDAHYWCLPPKREDSDEVVAIGNGYKFHLVSQGRQVGVWKNWTVAKSMVSGYPDSAHKGHHSYGSCVKEWQAHCQLGVHPHPMDPNFAKRKGPQAGGSSRPPHHSSSTPASRRTSGALSAMGGSRPGGVQYFAIWGAGVVYSTK